MTTLVTLSGNIADLVGDTDLDNDSARPNRRVKVSVTSNAPGKYIADIDNSILRLGAKDYEATDGKRCVEEDGSFEFADLIATGSTGTNLDDSANLQYTVLVDFPSQDPAYRGKRTQLSFGPFAVESTSNVADLVAEQAVDVSYASTTMAAMQALLDDMEEISGLSDLDASQAYNIANGPLTGAALSDAIGGVASPLIAAATADFDEVAQRAHAKMKRLKAQTAGRLRQVVNGTIGALRLSTALSALETSLPSVTAVVNSGDALFTATAHGMAVGDRFRMVTKTGGMYMSGATYYVKTAPSANTFTLYLSGTSGASLDIGSDITAGTAAKNVPIQGFAYQRTVGTGSFALSGSATAATDLFTTTTAHTFVVGDTFTLTGSTAGGTADDTKYYVRTVPSPTTFTAAATRGGATLNITSDDASLTVNRVHPGLLVTDGRAVQRSTSYPQYDYIQADLSVISVGGGIASATGLTVETITEDSSIEVALAQVGAGTAQVYVDDVLWETIAYTDLSGAGVTSGLWGARYYTFPDARRRRIKVHTSNMPFVGFFYNQSKPISRPAFSDNMARVLVVGDSFTEGTGSTNGLGFVEWLQRQLGYRDVWRVGSGSTGYASDGSGRLALEDRYQNDVIDQAPDVVIWAMGINDPRSTSGDRTATVASATTCWDALTSQRPDTEQIVVGPWPNNGGSGVDSTLAQLDLALQAAAESRGLRFVSPIQDGLLFTTVDGTHPNSASTGHENLGGWLAGWVDTYSQPA